MNAVSTFLPRLAGSLEKVNDSELNEICSSGKSAPGGNNHECGRAGFYKGQAGVCLSKYPCIVTRCTEQVKPCAVAKTDQKFINFLNMF